MIDHSLTYRGVLEGKVGDLYDVKCVDRDGNYYSVQLLAVKECNPTAPVNPMNKSEKRPVVWTIIDSSLGDGIL